MKSQKASNDLEFLDSYWEKAKAISDKIQAELPIMNPNNKPVSKGKLSFINFSELDSWSVTDIMMKLYGKSKTLEILANKIQDMIYKGRGNDVKDMVAKIATGRIKTHYKPKPIILHQDDGKRESLGKGHFRWNWQVYTLTDQEIQFLKLYFKL